jgi:hypothetical protein
VAYSFLSVSAALKEMLFTLFRRSKRFLRV